MSAYRFNPYLKGMVFCLFSLLQPHSLFAVEKLDTTKTYRIEEITITEQYRKAEVRTTAPFQSLSANQINKLNVLQVSDAVKHFSGVMVRDYGGIGGLKTISVRSLGANHTAVSYDGITLTDCQTGQIDIGRFSLDNVEMISLNNGQSDNIFQPARLFSAAALLHIKTLSPQFDENTSLHGKVSLKTGSFGLFNPSFRLQQKISPVLVAAFGGEWLTAHGQYPYLLDYSYLGSGITSKEIRKNTDVNNLRLEAALYANLTEKESAYLKAYYYASERGLPGATILYNTDNFSSQRMWDKTFFVQGQYKKDVADLLSMQVNAKYHLGLMHYQDTTYLNDIGKMESLFQQQEYYASVALLYRAFNNLSFSFSTDGFVNQMLADFETPELTDTFARPTRFSLLSVLAARFVSNEVLATASMLSTITNESVEVGEAAANQRRLSPYLSVAYKPFAEHDLRLRFFYKNIFRLPGFNDLYYARTGNAGLLPEFTNQLNAGITYALSYADWLPLFSVTADVYRNYVKDKIVALPTKNIFIWSMVNLGKVQVDGLDLTVETSFMAKDKIVVLLGGTYTYQRALDVTTPGSNTYGHQIPYTPRVSGSGKLGVETPWVDVSYSLLWSGDRYAGYQNYAENRLPGYVDHSVSVSRDFNISNYVLSFNVEALNLSDENYAVVKWFPMPGRSYRATVGVRF
jgi:vitamin B12 transporter